MKLRMTAVPGRGGRKRKMLGAVGKEASSRTIQGSILQTCGTGLCTAILTSPLPGRARTTQLEVCWPGVLRLHPGCWAGIVHP